jgi:hypothetical protein
MESSKGGEVSKSSNYTKEAYRTPHTKRNAPGGTAGKGLVNQAESYDDNEAAKAEKLVGSESAAMDRYLANPSRAALDAVIAIRAQKARAV